VIDKIRRFLLRIPSERGNDGPYEVLMFPSFLGTPVTAHTWMEAIKVMRKRQRKYPHLEHRIIAQKSGNHFIDGQWI